MGWGRGRFPGSGAARLARAEPVPGVGRRYAATTRACTVIPTIVVAVLAADPGGMRLTVAVAMGGLTLWSGIYVRRVTGPVGEWLTWSDVAILALLSMSVKWTVPGDWIAAGQSWLVPFVSFAAVSYQFYASPRTGAIGAVLLAAAMVAGLAVALPTGTWSDSLVTASWSLVLCLLGRMLRVLVERGGRAARQAAGDLAALRRDQQVARAVRADERRMLDTLHDTAASTLLMVGMGAAGRAGRCTLADRAARDLAVLEALPEQHPTQADLVRSIVTACEGHGVEVRYDGPVERHCDGAVVRAVTGAAGEAVRNAARHAGVGWVGVRVRVEDARLLVEIHDQGCGFDPAAVTTGRRGMRESIVRRMADAGGRATVESVPGAGTVVRLGWPA